MKKSKTTIHFPPPKRLVQDLLTREPTLAAFRQINTYASRPIYSDAYDLLQPDYHPDQGVLIHGPHIEPIQFSVAATGTAPLDRLPPRLRQLLCDFPFENAADLANCVGLLLVGLLARQFSAAGKPLGILDSNQPGTGKTTLVQCVGIILDGATPQLIPYSMDDEELRKKTTALLMAGRQSVIVLDNARVVGAGAIQSPWLESASTVSEYSDRVLGHSKIFRRPNDLLWLITANSARVGPDIASRSIVVRLAVDGDAAARHYAAGNILQFALQHRNELLAELYGMVEYWSSQGRSRVDTVHRFQDCTQVVGGILHACGFPEFLANQSAVSQSIDTRADDLAALAEAVLPRREAGGFHIAGVGSGNAGQRPGEWLPIFVGAKLLVNELEEARSLTAKATRIGRFLTPLVNRSVTIDVAGTTHSATLRCRVGASNARYYWFEVARGEEQAGPDHGNVVASGVNTIAAAASIPASPCDGGNNLHWRAS